ncbi:MAG: cupredoxin domain-containing protein [Acidimicrobiia bacterium]
MSNIDTRRFEVSARAVLIWSGVIFTAMMAPFTALVVYELGRDANSAQSLEAQAARGPAPGTKTASCPNTSAFTGPVTDHGSEVAAGASMSITAGDSFFQPTCTLSLPKGTATITIANTGSILHNITIPGQKIDKNVSPGQTINVAVDLSAGDVVYYCKFHRTSGMVGSLAVPQ